MKTETKRYFSWAKISLVVAITLMILLQGCATVYDYYYLDDLEMVNWVVNADANLNRGKQVTKCVAAYPDSTGRMVYLMESKSRRYK